MSTQSAFPACAMLVLALSTASVQAHDPSEHKAKPARPDCAAMKDMDMSKMDMDDPVMKAMKEKCRMAMHQDGDEHADAGEAESSAEAHSHDSED